MESAFTYVGLSESRYLSYKIVFKVALVSKGIHCPTAGEDTFSAIIWFHTILHSSTYARSRYIAPVTVRGGGVLFRDGFMVA